MSRKAAQVKPAHTKAKPPPSVPPSTESAGVPSFTFEGRTETFSTGAKLLAAVFSTFASMDSDFCRRYSERYTGRVRKYVARSKEELYPGNSRFHSSVLPLPGGWMVATHCSSAEKVKRIKQACEVIGLEFGRDVVVELPAGVRGKKDG